MKSQEEIVVEEKITGQQLYDMYVGGLPMNEVFKDAKEKGYNYPIKPSKPILKKDHNAEELKKYTFDFEFYGVEMEAYKTYMITYREREAEINSALEEFVKIASGFYDHVPKNKQSKVWNRAWEDGHSSGYHEVFIHLEGLVDIFMD